MIIISNKTKSLIASIALGTILTSGGILHAQNSIVASIEKKVLSNRKSSAQWGSDITINGDFAFVSAYTEKIDNESSGALYVLKKDANGDWVEHQRLQSSIPKKWAEYGFSISSDGDYLAVGEPESHTKAGRVFIYKLESSGLWQLHQTLLPDGAIKKLSFLGYQVAMEGNTLVIGSPKNSDYDSDGNREKAINNCLIYELDSSGQFVFKQKIFSDTPDTKGHFGAALDFKDGKIIVGAYDKKTLYHLAGGAYVYSKDVTDTWVLEGTLLPNDLVAQDNFGTAVSISGDYAIVSSIWHTRDENGQNNLYGSGASYLFKYENNQWSQIQKLVPSNRAHTDFFGKSLDINNDVAVIGSVDRNETGAAFVFKLNDAGLLEETDYISPSELEDNDHFSYSVAVTDDQIFIGAIKHSYDPTNTIRSGASGAIFIADLIEENNSIPEEVFVGPEDKFVPNDRDSHDDFGTAIAISGDFAIVGADREDHDANDANKLSNSGSAYILGKNQYGYWNEVQKLIPSDREDKDFFGQAVDIDGDYAVIGSFNRVNKNDGAAYVFKKGANDVWVETDKLIIPNAATNPNFFGASVAISGDVIAIGAPEETVVENGQTLSKAGKIYVFEKDGFGNWIFATELVSSDIATKDRLGFSVDIDDNNIIAGAYFNNPQSNGSNINDGGAAYIFSKQNGSWVESQKLIANNAFHADYFGYDVSIDGDVAVVGAYGQDQGLFDITKEERAGGAYIFKNENGTWSQVQELIADDREADDRFGSSVAINGSNILIGAYGDNKPGSILTNGSNKAGAAYAYHTSDFNQWSLIRKINSDFREEGDEFGKSVALYGEDIIIGAPGEEEDRIQDNEKDRAGAVYFYNISTTPFAKTAFDNDNTTGIEKLSNTVKAFPNPIENQLTIQLDNVADKIDIQVINLNGQVVEQLLIENQSQVQLQLEHLTAGVYIVKVNTDTVSNVIQVVKK